ncbi:hypothetical protein HMPREF0290_2066 [Corynebacterium efficiens YS-314]|nr:hypothetical protein HMPREF0290_2066 [Corynebacterium efficiens YS-314]
METSTRPLPHRLWVERCPNQDWTGAGLSYHRSYRRSWDRVIHRAVSAVVAGPVPL